MYCPEGHYCPQGSSAPIPCVAGSYSDATHLSECKTCPAGFYCLANATTYTDTPCPKGEDMELESSKYIWPWHGLNTQPSDLESDALPIAPQSLLKPFLHVFWPMRTHWGSARTPSMKPGKKLTLTWLEHAAFRSGVGRATNCTTESVETIAACVLTHVHPLRFSKNTKYETG